MLGMNTTNEQKRSIFEQTMLYTKEQAQAATAQFKAVFSISGANDRQRIY